jgi:hypothetical protein
MPGWMNDIYKKFTNVGNENKGKLFYYFINYSYSYIKLINLLLLS